MILLKIQAYDVYSQIASGNRLTSASKDPAGLAISEKLNSQVKGNEQAQKNIESSQDLLRTAEGSLNSISDSLLRVRELAVQASNGILTADDKSIIQKEINSLFDTIQSSAQNTEFNGMKLLDGSFKEKNLGAGANGQGTIMQLENTSLESLGIKGFSVEGNFDIGKIDEAITKVTNARSQIGAEDNGLQANLNNTQVSTLQQTASRATIADTDIAKSMMELNKQRILEQYQISALQKQKNLESEKLGLLV